MYVCMVGVCGCVHGGCVSVCVCECVCVWVCVHSKMNYAENDEGEFFSKYPCMRWLIEVSSRDRTIHVRSGECLVGQTI